MPYIIILTGHPCSGKSTLARLIRERALSGVYADRLSQVVLVEDDDPTDTAAYATAAVEKVMRAALKAAFDRAVATAVHDETTTGKKTLILLDSTNYIKGYRYELFCIGKAAASRYCVVWCLNDIHIVKQWNAHRQEQNASQAYPDEVLEALLLRYEPPDARNRWDKPLFCIDVRPPHLRNQEEGIAGQVLHHSLYNMHNLSAALPPPSSSTSTDNSSALAQQPKGNTTSSAFKKSAFQKKKTTSSSSAPVALTSESLSAFQAATSNGPVPSEMAPSPQHEKNPTKPAASTRWSSDASSVQEQVDAFLQQFLGGQVAALHESTSTRSHTAVDANVLHRVDSITQQLCTSLLEALQNGTASEKEEDDERLKISFREGEIVYFDCPMDARKALTAPELRRIRQEYLQWMGKYPSPEASRERSIVESFLTYVAAHERR